MKIMCVFGTRPEAIKMAPLVRALKEDPRFETLLCVTAQHRSMLDQVLELFELEPDYDLNLMRPEQTLSMISSSVLEGLGAVLEQEKPDLVLVHGDTTTTMAAALAAFYQRTAVGHVEAGLRTYDKYSPFPEEINRQIVSRIADIFFAPTEANRQNLIREGINGEKVFVTGNTVIDALLSVAEKPYSFEDEALKNLDFERKRIITVTCHRRENLGENMAAIFTAVADIACEFDDVEIIYPVHLNPKVQEAASKYLSGLPNVHLIEPLTYQPFVKLMANSFLIITDSGGMQEEAPALGKPVLVVRKETERPEAIEAGTARLVGVERPDIYAAAKELLTSESLYQAMAQAINPYGDGRACERIISAIKTVFL